MCVSFVAVVVMIIVLFRIIISHCVSYYPPYACGRRIYGNDDDRVVCGHPRPPHTNNTGKHHNGVLHTDTEPYGDQSATGRRHDEDPSIKTGGTFKTIATPYVSASVHMLLRILAASESNTSVAEYLSSLDPDKNIKESVQAAHALIDEAKNRNWKKAWSLLDDNPVLVNVNMPLCSQQAPQDSGR